ncbi:unnamed protein product [Moneuplotes crassus]|uniref:Uncharacterized protein n=1 Tax=Euplotes crassus TaxID=5936 RepID=A0AAD2D5Z1_EUPCR|nr:unnamed protein product [Moneuplotes crassus]
MPLLILNKHCEQYTKINLLTETAENLDYGLKFMKSYMESFKSDDFVEVIIPEQECEIYKSDSSPFMTFDQCIEYFSKIKDKKQKEISQSPIHNLSTEELFYWHLFSTELITASLQCTECQAGLPSREGKDIDYQIDEGVANMLVV